MTSIVLQSMQSSKVSLLDIYLCFHSHHIRCLSLLHEHPERGAISDVLIEAGESAWACGAHEVRNIVLASTRCNLVGHSSPYNLFSMPEHFSGKISGRRRRHEHCIYCLDLQRELLEQSNGLVLTHACRLFTWKGE